MQDYDDKGSARCNWVFYALVTKGHKTSGTKNRRQNGHKQHALLGQEEKGSFQGHEEPDLSCRAFGDTDSPGESESTSSRHTSGEPWIGYTSTPPSLAGNKSTPCDSSEALLALTSGRAFTSYTRQDCNLSTDQCTFNETLSKNNKARSHFPETRHKNFRIWNVTHLLLTFSQEFLITHSAFSSASFRENPCIKRRTVLKVSLPDFAGLSDKICAKCRSRMYDSGVRKLSHTLCQDLSNQTKVILRRINLTQRSNRQDCANKMNKFEITLKNSTALSTDLNYSVKDMYVNKNIMSNNACENTSVKPLSEIEHMPLSKEPSFTKDHRNVGIKGTKEDKRKLPPLKIPKEIILPQNYNNVDAHLQDDETPEYPLQEGDVFFKPQVNDQESKKNHIQIEITEQSRNVFSDFLTELSYPETQVLTLSKNSNINNGNCDSSDRKQDTFLEAHKTSNFECAQWPEKVSGITTSKVIESEASQSGRRHLSQKSLTEVSWQRRAADICGNGPEPLSVGQLCDSSSDSQIAVIKNSKDYIKNSSGSRVVEQKNSSGGLKNSNDGIKNSNDGIRKNNDGIKNSNDRKVEQKNDIININYTKHFEIIDIQDGEKTSTCSKTIVIKKNNDDIKNSFDIKGSNGGKKISTDSGHVHEKDNNDSKKCEIKNINYSIKDSSGSKNIDSKTSPDNKKNSTDNTKNSTDNTKNSTDNTKNSTDNTKNSTDNTKNSTDNVKNSTDSKLYEVKNSTQVPYLTSVTAESPSYYKLSYFHPQLQPPALIRSFSDNVIQHNNRTGYFETYSQTKDSDDEGCFKSSFNKLPQEEATSSTSPHCAEKISAVKPERVLDINCRFNEVKACDEKGVNHQNVVLQYRQNYGLLDKMDTSRDLNSPSRTGSLKMYIRRKVSSPAETKSYEDSYSGSSNNSGGSDTVEMNKMDFINSFGNNNTGKNITYNIFHNRADRDNGGEVIIHGEYDDNNTVKTMGRKMGNEGLCLPSEKSLVKLDQHLPQTLEGKLTSNHKGRDKKDTFQNKPAATAETTTITEVQHSSRPQEMNDCSAGQNISRERSNLLNKVTINLGSNRKSQSENVSFLDTPRETQERTIPRKHVSKSRYRDPINNIANMSLNTQRHLSCEKASPDITKKSNSLRFPDSQFSSLKNDHSSLFEVNNKGRMFELQKSCQRMSTLHNITEHPVGTGEINYAGDCRMRLTSGECMLPVTHSNDREQGHSASKSTAVKSREDISEHTISTVKMNATDTLEITAKTVNNSYIHEKSNESRLSHEHKQISFSRTNVNETVSLLVSPKRRLHKRAGATVASKVPDSYDTAEVMMSQETEHKAPRKKLRGTELLDNDRMLDPASNMSSTATMVDSVGSQSKRKKQTSPVPQKQIPLSSRAARVSPRGVSSSAEHHTEGEPTIQRESPLTVSPQSQEISTFVKTTPTGMFMGRQLSPATSALKVVARNLESNLRETNHLVLEPPLSNETDPLVSQSTKKVTETSGQINVSQIEYRQLKSKLFSSSLTQQSNARIVVDQLNSNPSQLSFQKAANSPKGNITPALSYVLDPYVVGNLSPLIPQSAKGSTNRHLPSEKSHKQIIDGLNNSNQYEQLSGKSNVSNTNSSKSEAFGRKMNSVHHLVPPNTCGENNVSNTSVEQSHFDPLKQNMAFMPQLSAETSVRNTVTSFHTHKPVEKICTRRGCTKKYCNLMLFPMQVQVNHMNQQLPWSSLLHPVETDFYENMLRYAQGMQVPQQHNADQQIVGPGGKVMYPSWVRIPQEQICSKNNTTAASKSLNPQLVPSSNPHALSEKESHKSHYVCNSPAPNAFFNDSPACSNSSGHDDKRSPREQERSELVGSSRNSRSPCEPLDLSPDTGKNAFHSDLFQQINNSSQSSYSQPLSGTHANVNRTHSTELHEHTTQNSSSHRVPLQAHSKGNNREMSAPRTPLLAMLKTTPTISLPTALSSTKSSVPHNKLTLSQSTLQNSNIHEEQNVNPITRVQSEHLTSQVTSSPCERNELRFSSQTTTAVETVHSSPSISQAASSPCERNELRLSAQATPAVEQHTQSQLAHLAVSTSTQLKDCSVITYSSLTTCLPTHQTIVSASSSGSNQSSVTQSSLTRPIVSSTCDLTKEMKSSDSESVDGVTAALSSHGVCSSVNLTTTRQITKRAHTDSSSVPSILKHQSHIITSSSSNYLPRVVPLPIKDFFTQTPKENAYSTLLMAEITSQSKRRLGIQKGIDVFPPAKPQNRSEGSTFEVNNSFQRKQVIDLTEDNDDCDVVSISSKDSLDDDSRIDFLDLTMRDRVPTPGSVTASSSIGEAATVIESSKNLQSTALPGDISVRADIHSDFSDVDVITPRYIHDSCHVHDVHGRKETFSFDKTEFHFDDSSGTEDTTETYTTVECQIQPSSAHLVLTHPLSNLYGRESFEIPKRRSTAENSIPPSHMLKIVPECKDIMANKVRNVVASRPSCGRLPSGDFMTPVETSHTEKLSHENKQQQIMTSLPHPAGITLSTHDNSTQRAAATLLELSANPLYNPYTIRPETSDDYQEKVYLVHPTLEDSEIDRQDSCRDTQKGSEKSRARTGRRVGRPPKYQLCSDPADSEENKTILSNSTNSYISPSNSTPSTGTRLVTINTCTNFRPTSASRGYEHTSSALQNTSDDDGLQFIGINAGNNESHDQTSSHSSSKTKRRQKPTENQNGKRQRRNSIQENMQIIEEHDSEMAVETDNVMSNMKSTTYNSNIESPTFQGPLHFIIGHDKGNPNNACSSVTELGNNLTENESRNKCKKKRTKPQSKKKHSNQQESFISDIDKVLQQLNSNEAVANIVVKTSFKDGVHALALQSEAESDFNQQSPQNGDQIVPVNRAHTQDSWAKPDTETNQSKISTPNGNTSIMISQPLPTKLLTNLVNSEPNEFHNSIKQSGNTTLDTEATGEIEKEQAVTSLLAEMMHSRMKGCLFSC